MMPPDDSLLNKIDYRLPAMGMGMFGPPGTMYGRGISSLGLNSMPLGINALGVPPPLVGKLDQPGGSTLPGTPPVLPNNQAQAPTDMPPSQSANPDGDFLKVVRDTIGGIGGGILNVLGASTYTVARPTYELYMHPQRYLEMGQELVQDISQHGVRPETLRMPIDILNRKFEEETDSGL